MPISTKEQLEDILLNLAILAFYVTIWSILDDFMGEIPSDLLQILKDTFKKCDDVFWEYRDLLHIFSDSRLRMWQDHLPEASNLGQRIERTIHYLQSKENAQDENALVLFIHVLIERYPSDDKRHDLLLTIIHKLQPTTSPTLPKDQDGIVAEANPQLEPMLTISELEQIRQRAHSVAFIEVTRYRQGKGEYRETGTGWLLAPGLVLTCWHVVATLASTEELPPTANDLNAQIEHMLLSFNHIEISKGGIQYKVSTLEYPLNGTDRQDFAILRLEDRSDQPYRLLGYLPIELDTPFTKQIQLSIIQHPFGQHQQIAVKGHFVSLSRSTGRILYTTATEAGTSGAPVLNHYNFRAVALHNGENREARLREGTRIKSILSELQDKKPILYNEIVEAQRTLNNPLPLVHGANPLDPYSHSSETTLQASFSPITSTEQGTALSSLDRHANYLNRFSQRPEYSRYSTYRCDSSILSLAFHPEGQYLASGEKADTIKLWDISSTSGSFFTLKNYAAATPSIAFSPDGHYLASGGDDGTIKLWDFLSRKRVKTLQGHTEWISCLAFSDDGLYLVSGSDDRSIQIREVPSGAIIRHLKEPSEVFRVTFNPLNQLIASCTSNQHVKLWSIFPSRIPSFKEPLTGIHSLIFSPDGRYLAAGNDKGSIIICDTTTWKTVRVLTTHSGKTRCLAFHPNSQLLASGGDNQTIQLWNMQTGTAIQILEKHTDRIESIAFSPDGQFIATGGRDTSIILWKHM